MANVRFFRVPAEGDLGILVRWAEGSLDPEEWVNGKWRADARLHDYVGPEADTNMSRLITPAEAEKAKRSLKSR
jgi:hypothetical protein